jgi:hypothetical protein
MRCPPKKCRDCRYFAVTSREDYCAHPEARDYNTIGDTICQTAISMRAGPVCGPEAKLFQVPYTIKNILKAVLFPSEPKVSGS